MTQNDSPKKLKCEPELVAALAKGKTVRDAAAEAGLSERTIFRRLQQPEFRREIQNVRTMLLSDVVGQLVDAGSQATTTLVNLLGARSEHVQLGAARAILELAPKMRESTELAERVADLERRLLESADETKGRKPWAA